MSMLMSRRKSFISLIAFSLISLISHAPFSGVHFIKAHVRFSPLWSLHVVPSNEGTNPDSHSLAPDEKPALYSMLKKLEV